MTRRPLLIAFAGLPGAGKTTLACAIARERRAAFLRIDTIEQAIRDASAPGQQAEDVGPAGYVVGYALAEANLRLGLDVVADSVNPLRITRDAWRRAAVAADAGIVEVEVACTDAAEHRRRIEHRVADIAGLTPPAWPDVLSREYESWDRDRVVVDTARLDVAAALAQLVRSIEALAATT